MLLQQVKAEMQRYFGSDHKRIEHALQVAHYAGLLLEELAADRQVTLAAAYLHDIGIHEAERRHGSNAGRYQELEGPAVARPILEQLGAEAELIEQVCEIISRHHTPGGVDSAEFRIIWDADALVNLREILPGKPLDEVEKILRRSLVTLPGYRLACRVFAR